QVLERERVARLVEDLLEGRVAVTQLALQGARTHVEALGHLLLRGLAGRQALREHLAHARPDVAALDACQVARAHRIAQARELRVAAVEGPPDALGVEDQPVLFAAEADGRAPLALEVLEYYRARAAQLDGERGVVAADQAAAHAHVHADERVDRLR